ncbi:MAG: phosphoglucosamine mutase [Halobacteriales archaeon]|nr:phosphoglucosamine mutase [Halobacteriales archaeon]
MFGTSGIRGRAGVDVTPSLAMAVGRALALDADRVVVGRDPRDTGSPLVNALSAGLTASGADVVRLGVAATPTVARSVAWRDADAGVSVTASHNPPPDNGLKLWQPSGQAFDAERRAQIEERLEADAGGSAAWDAWGTETTWRGARERHADAVVAAVGSLDGLSIAVDLGNGAGGVTIDALDRLGASVTALNAQPDGRFPARASEPTAESLAALRRFVAAGAYDLGLAHDGDADRLMAVTGAGEFVPGDVLLALFAREAAGPGDRVAAPLNTSLLVDDALAEVGAELVRTRVGDVFVAERAAEADVVFGGEMSGAWIWPEATLCPDGTLAAAKLAALVRQGDPLAEQVAGIGRYPTRRDAVEVAEKGAVMDRVREAVLERYDDVETTDGVRVALDDAWFLVRASGTQPLVRLTAEARDADRADAVFEEVRTLVEDAV